MENISNFIMTAITFSSSLDDTSFPEISKTIEVIFLEYNLRISSGEREDISITAPNIFFFVSISTWTF